MEYYWRRGAFKRLSIVLAVLLSTAFSGYAATYEINTDGSYNVSAGDTALLAVGTVVGSVTVDNGGFLKVCGRYVMTTAITVNPGGKIILTEGSRVGFSGSFTLNGGPQNGGAGIVEYEGSGTCGAEFYQSGGNNATITGSTNPSSGDWKFSLSDQVRIVGGGTFWQWGKASTSPYPATVETASDALSCAAPSCALCSEPSISSTTDGNRMGTGTVILSATTDAGVVEWYDQAVGGSLLFTGNAFTTPVISATTVYYVQAVDGACFSSTRSTVTATINPPGAGNDCEFWMFGTNDGVRLEFSGGTVDPQCPGITGAPWMAVESSANYSYDGCGVKYYSNGEDVWDRDGALLNWCVANNIQGDRSAVQGVTIVKQPGNNSNVYVFTTGSSADVNNGAPWSPNYSIIDTMANAPVGDIVIDNQLLPGFTNPTGEGLEKLMLVPSEDQQFYWLIVPKETGAQDSVYVYRFDDTGITLANRYRFYGSSGIKATSQMAFSPLQNIVAIPSNTGGGVELYEVDVLNGKLRHERSIYFGGLSSVQGLEFSASGRYLFASDNVSSSIESYEVHDDNYYSVAAGQPYWNMKLGPDGRIYYSYEDNQFMGAIEDPDDSNQDLDYQDNPNAIDFSLVGCQNIYRGVPNNALSLCDTFSINVTPDDIVIECSSNFPVLLSASITNPMVTPIFEWYDTADANTVLSTSSTYNAMEGTYAIRVGSGPLHCWEEKLVEVRTQANLGEDIDLTCNNFPVFLDAEMDGVALDYRWELGGSHIDEFDGESEVYVHDPGQYVVEVMLPCGSVFDTIQVFNNWPGRPTDVVDTVCAPGFANMTITGSGTYEWYANEVGGVPINVGASYNDNILTSHNQGDSITTYWIQDNSNPPSSNVFGASSLTAPNWTSGATNHSEFTANAVFRIDSLSIRARAFAGGCAGAGSTVNLDIILFNLTDGVTVETFNATTECDAVESHAVDFHINEVGKDYEIRYTNMGAGGAMYYQTGFSPQIDAQFMDLRGYTAGSSTTLMDIHCSKGEVCSRFPLTLHQSCTGLYPNDLTQVIASPTNNSVDVSWVNDPGYDSIFVAYGRDSSAAAEGSITIFPPASAAALGGLVNDTLYYFNVIAYDNGLESKEVWVKAVPTYDAGRAVQFESLQGDHGRADIYIGTDFTVETWFNTTYAAAERQAIVTFNDLSAPLDDYFAIRLNTQGQLEVELADATILTHPEFLDNDHWYHVAATQSGSSVDVYLNGIPVLNHVSAIPPINDSVLLYVGRYNDTDTNQFDGEMDELRIWNYARGSFDIDHWKDKPLRGNHAGLEHVWHFDEQEGLAFSPNGAVNNKDIVWVNEPQKTFSTAMHPFPVEDFCGQVNGPNDVMAFWSPSLSTDAEFLHILSAKYGETWTDLTVNASNSSEMFVGLETDSLYLIGIAVEDSAGNMSDTVGTYFTPVIESGQAVVLDGVSEYVEFSDFDSIGNGQFTAMCWARMDAKTGTYNMILAKWDGSQPEREFIIGYDNNANNELYGQVRNEDGGGQAFVQTGIEPELGEWFHVALSYDGTALRFYLNGYEVAVNNAASGAYAMNKDVTLTAGSSHDGVAGSFWNGAIDEIAVFDYALAPGEIESYRDVRIYNSASGLTGVWHFDEPSEHDFSVGSVCGTEVAYPNSSWSKETSLAMHPWASDSIYVTYHGTDSVEVNWPANLALDIDSTETYYQTGLSWYQAETVYSSDTSLVITGSWTPTDTLKITNIIYDYSGQQVSSHLFVYPPAAVACNPLIVTSPGDTPGDTICGELRAAIIYANSNPGADTITFSAGIINDTIKVLSPELPTITGDGTVVQGDSDGDGVPDVKISKQFGNDGLEVNANDVQINGVKFDQFSIGVNVFGGNRVKVSNCYFGTLDGVVLGNVFTGVSSSGGGNLIVEDNVFYSGSTAVFAGDSAVVKRNYIGLDSSGLVSTTNYNAAITVQDYGVVDSNVIHNGSHAIQMGSFNKVRSNYVHTDKTGMNVVGAPGGQGIIVSGSNNVIGDTLGGGNVITHLNAPIIYISNGAEFNQVYGNRIGVGKTGLNSLGVLNTGLLILGKKNTIGNTSPNGRNIISNIQGSGVAITITNDSNLVEGNIIGLDLSGTNDFGSLSNGVSTSSTLGVIIKNNVISGNGGFGIHSSMDSNLVIQGNTIGLDIAGSNTIGNDSSGVYVSNSSLVLIGGHNAQEGNVISGNGIYGIHLRGVDSCLVIGNKVGSDGSGLLLRSNITSAIRLDQTTSHVHLGDTATSNIFISGGGSTVWLNDAHQNYVVGNNIGVGADGQTTFNNGLKGVMIDGGSTENNIFDNQIYDNGFGIDVFGFTTRFNRFFENSFVGNGIPIRIFSGQENIAPPVITGVVSAADTTVQGTAAPFAMIQLYADSSLNAQHLIDTAYADASGDWSIQLTTEEIFNLQINGLDTLVALQDSAGNTSEFSQPQELDVTAPCNPLLVTLTSDSPDPGVCGELRAAIHEANNQAGPNSIQIALPSGSVINVNSDLPAITGDSTELAAGWDGSGLPNLVLDGGNTGINGLLIQSNYNEISGLNVRRFSGMPNAGIEILGGSHNRIFGNFIGTDRTGQLYIGYGNDYGVVIDNTSKFNAIGDTSATHQANVISGNTTDGIFLDGADFTYVAGNVIGTNFDGTVDLPNGVKGIYIANNADSNYIGYNGIGNLISGNAGDGIEVNGSTGNLITSNIIGLDSSRNFSIPNTNSGIHLHATAETQIGDGTAQGRNTIANNGLYAIELTDASDFHNRFHWNSIYGNITGGISFHVASQENVSVPVVTEILGGGDTTIYGTAAPGAMVQVYADSANQGQYAIDTTYADINGDWSLKVTGGEIDAIPAGLGNITALQDSSDNTSGFAVPILATIQSVATDSVVAHEPSDVNWCIGSTYDIPYEAFGSGLGTGSIFTVRLYNAATEGDTTLVGSQVRLLGLGIRDSVTTNSIPNSLNSGEWVVILKPGLLPFQIVDTITISDVPARPSITGPTTVCLGGTVTYKSSIVSTDTYFWSTRVNSPVSSGLDSLAIDMLTGVEDTVLLYLGNSCGFSEEDTLVVAINDIPTKPTITGPTTVCLGGIETYRSAVLSADTYFWSTRVNSPISSGLDSLAMDMLTGVEDTVLLQLGNSCGFSEEDTLVVAINDVPTKPTITGPTTVCLGGTETYRSSVLSADTYFWSTRVNSPISSGLDSLAIDMLTGVEDTVLLQLGNSCGFSEEDTLIVNLESGASFTSALADTLPTCEGGSEVVNLLVNGITDTVVWTGANLSLVNDAAPNYTLEFSTGSGYVYATASSACGNAVDSMYVELKAAPSFVNTLLDTISGCFGAPVNVSLSVAGVSDSLVWTGANLNGVVDAAPSYDLDVSVGSDYVYATGYAACGNVADSIWVVIDSMPALATISGPDTVCLGSTNAFLSDAIATTFSWDYEGFNSTLANPSITSSNVGQDTIFFNYGNSCGAGLEVFKIITVESGASFTSALADTLTTCEGGSKIVNLQVNGITDTVVWTGANLSLVGDAAPNYTLDFSTGSGYVYATAYSTCGNVMDSVYVQLDIAPSFVNALPDTIAPCFGTTETVDASITGAYDSLVWTANGLDIVGAGPNYDVSGPLGEAYAKATIYASCGLLEDSILVQVNDMPATVSIVGSNTLCVNEVQNYHSTGPAENITWTLNGNTMAVDTVPFVNLIPAIDTLVLNYGNTCGAGVADSIVITTHGAPTFLNTLADTIVACQGTPFNVTLNTSASTDSVVWTGVNLENANVGASIHQLSASIGDAYMYVTAYGSCGNATDSIYVSTLNVPGLPTIVGQDMVCEGDTSAYTVAGGFDSYNWMYNGVSVSNTTTVEVNNTALGIDTLVIEVQNICGTNYDTVLIDVEGLPSISGVVDSVTNCSGQPIVLSPVFSANIDQTVYAGSLLDSAVNTTLYVQPGSGLVTITSDNRCGIATESVFVEAHDTLSGLEIIGANEICENTIGALYESSEQGNNYIYDWTVFVFGGSFVENEGSVVVNAGGSAIGIGLTVTNYCNAITSPQMNVSVRSTIQLPIYQTEDSLCYGESTELTIPSIAGYSYEWYDVADPGTVLSSTASFIVTESITTAVTITANGCSAISDSASVFVDDFALRYNPLGENLVVCHPVFKLGLDSLNAFSTDYQYSLVGIDPAADTVVAIPSLLPDNSYLLNTSALYILTTVDMIGGCVDVDSMGIGLREAFVLLNDTVVNTHVEEEIVILINDFIWLQDSLYTVEILDSSQNATESIIQNVGLSYLPNSDFSGVDFVSYRVSSTECQGISEIATVQITVVPAAVDDEIITDDNDLVSDEVFIVVDALELLANDRGDIQTIEWGDSSYFGALLSLGASADEREISYSDDVKAFYAGQTVIDTLYYEACDGDTCIPGKAFYEVRFDEIVINSIDTAFTYRVFNLVTPNGDGVNDYLKLEFFTIVYDTISGDSVETRVIPESSNIQIYSKWGDMVYSSNDYRNDSESGFVGVNTNPDIPSVGILPEGTYYYILEYEIKDQKRPETVSGFLLLVRED